MRTPTLVFATGVVALVAVVPASAQELELGLTGGYNRTDWAVDAAAEAVVGTGLGARNTFSIGAFTALDVMPGIALQSEALYTRRGTAFRGTGVIEGEELTFDAAYETSYVQVPLLVRVAVPVTRSIEPFVAAGPAVAFEWGSRIKGTVSSGGQSAPFEVESDGFKGTDVGLILGAGAAAEKDGGMVYLHARYELGVSSILEPTEGEDPGSVKNRAFSILVGFSTPIEI